MRKNFILKAHLSCLDAPNESEPVVCDACWNYIYLEIADLIGRGAAAQNPECWDLGVGVGRARYK